MKVAYVFDRTSWVVNGVTQWMLKMMTESSPVNFSLDSSEPYDAVVFDIVCIDKLTSFAGYQYILNRYKHYIKMTIDPKQSLKTIDPNDSIMFFTSIERTTHIFGEIASRTPCFWSFDLRSWLKHTNSIIAMEAFEYVIKSIGSAAVCEFIYDDNTEDYADKFLKVLKNSRIKTIFRKFNRSSEEFANRNLVYEQLLSHTDDVFKQNVEKTFKNTCVVDDISPSFLVDTSCSSHGVFQ